MTWREPLEDMLRERSAQIEKLKTYFKTVFRYNWKGYRLEDIIEIIRITKVGTPNLERLTIDFSVFNIEKNYKNYKQDIVWYFQLPLEEQPGPTITYLYNIFFAAAVKLPSKLEINYRE